MMSRREFNIDGRRVVVRIRSDWPFMVTRWLATTVAIMVVPSVVSGVHVEDVWSALAASAVLGVLNALVWNSLYLFALPCAMLTLGLSIFVVNALLFQLAGAMVPGLAVDSFWSALWASLFVSLVSWFAHAVLRTRTTRQPAAGLGTSGETAEAPPRMRPQYRSKRTSTVDLERDEDGKWK